MTLKHSIGDVLFATAVVGGYWLLVFHTLTLLAPLF